MKIKSIKAVGRLPVYDISVESAEHYVLENGVVTHNTGGTYSATNIFFISKSQEKTQKDGLLGFTFKIKIEKSRYVKEQSIIPITVNFNGGVSRYSGLFDIAMETGDMVSPKNGWYTRNMCNPETGEVIEDSKSWRKSEMSREFWITFLANSNLKKNVIDRYRLSDLDIMSNIESDMETKDEEDDDE